ncbi:DnaA-like domain protein (plasmid) [Candidatus Megaera polyxenophila]|nr:DnaA-like domain protein [Candidatus Megaera polyxenophila]
MAYLAQKHEQKSQRPIYPEAYQYYLDLYAEKETCSFHIIKDIWENIPQNNTRDKPLTESQLKLVAIIYALIEKSDNRVTYFSLEFLCTKLKITDRQLRTVRKAISHIFHSKWRKAIKIKGIRRENIYVFSYACRGKIILEATDKYYKSIKLGSTIPTSYNKYENNKKNIDHESTSFLISEEVEIKENTAPTIIIFPKEPVKLKKRLLNKRKKPTNAEKKGKVYKPFAYTKPKNLADMLPLIDPVTCEELRSKSGRPFSDNFIIQLVLKMSKNSKIKASFDYKNGFIAYMARALRYEKHDAVKTGNINFRFKVNIPKNSNEHQEQRKPLELLKLPEGIWGDICQKLIVIYDEYAYRNWFSKLTPVIDKEAKTIELKAPNLFVKDWIETNYRDIIKEIAKSLELEFKGITYLLLPEKQEVFSCGTTLEEVIPTLKDKTTTNGFQSLSVFGVIDKLQIID